MGYIEILKEDLLIYYLIGLCMVGIVGLKFFWYCLFGDIINVVLRMKLNGLCK